MISKIDDNWKDEIKDKEDSNTLQKAMQQQQFRMQHKIHQLPTDANVSQFVALSTFNASQSTFISQSNAKIKYSSLIDHIIKSNEELKVYQKQMEYERHTLLNIMNDLIMRYYDKSRCNCLY